MSATTKLALRIILLMLVAADGSATGQSQNPPSLPTGQGEAAQQEARVRVSEKVAQLFLAKRVQPEYPQEARDKHIQGVVVLMAEISKEGDVTAMRLVSGHPLLAPAAVEAVKQWKYKPYLLKGQPVAVETQVSVSFVLSK
ncbi:MAG: energy transducer TonB [Candidatus Sulfotelmatobacter sp.]